ncbi:MAG: cation diffusion facilitator family transporter [Candidatus Odinarchaeia archaeon]
MIDDKLKGIELGIKTALQALAVTIFLFLIKMIVAFLSGSVSLRGDAFNSFSDIFTMFAAWFGLKISKRHPDERFPYGYYKVETFAALIVSIFILFLGIDLVLESISGILSPQPIQYTYLAILVTLVSISISYWLSIKLKNVGAKISSQALIASGNDRRMDVLTSSLVLISLILSYYGVLQAGGIIGLLFSALIFRTAILTGKDAALVLLDACMSPGMLKDVMRIIKETDGVIDVEEVKIRKSGPLVFGEAKVKVGEYLDVKRAHEITEIIENRLKPLKIDSFTIHIEPAEPCVVKLAIPIEKDEGLKSKISNHFGHAENILLAEIEKEQVKGYAVIENPYKNRESKVGLALSRLLSEKKINVLITKKLGEIAFHALRDNFIDVYKAEGETVEVNLNLFINKKLKRLRKYTESKDNF